MVISNRSKTPLWREFELLVARVEQALAGDGVKVVSPDRIRSLITGRLREVDASLRTRVGSSDVLVTVECRKRSAKQDVTWIEQLGCKKPSIGAARTIAVASSAFSKDAIEVAKHYGIDLRILSEIDDRELQSWLLPSFLVHVYKHCDLVASPEIEFFAEAGDDFSSVTPIESISGSPSTQDSPVFVAPDGTGLTLNDLWLRADDQGKIFDTIPTDNKVHQRQLIIKPSDELTLQTRLGLRKVKTIRMSLAMRWKHEELALGDATVVSYKPASQLDSLQPQVRVEFESKEATNANFRIGIQRQIGSSNASFTLQVLPGKK